MIDDFSKALTQNASNNIQKPKIVSKEIHKFFPKVFSFLGNLDYPDSLRISNEILEYISSCKDISNYKTKINEILTRIKNDEPWDYIRGYSEFSNHKFKVNKNVLIPRIETEELVEIASQEIRTLVSQYKEIQIIDVGTGSGCIIISLKNLLINIDSKWITLDVSQKALEIARKNAMKIIGNDNNIEFIKSDLLEEISDNHNSESLTFITANLPYIRYEEKESLDKSVANWEPEIALFDKGIDGLKLSKRLLDEASRKFVDFEIIFELDPSQIETMSTYALKQTNLSCHKYLDQYDKPRFLLIKNTKK